MEKNQTWIMTKHKIIFNWEAVKDRPDFIERGLMLFGKVRPDQIETYDPKDREKLFQTIRELRKRLTSVNT